MRREMLTSSMRIPAVGDIIAITQEGIERAVRVLSVFSTVDKKTMFMVGKMLDEENYIVHYHSDIKRRSVVLALPLYEIAWMVAIMQIAVATELVKTSLKKPDKAYSLEDFGYNRTEAARIKAGWKTDDGVKEEEREEGEEEEKDIDEII